MDGIPVQVILLPILGIAVCGYLVWQRKNMAKNLDQQNANYRAGQIAQRLGLRLVEGDPNFNIFIRQANVDVLRGPTDQKPVDIKIHMQGEAQGVPLEFVYAYRVEKQTGITTITWRTWFDCRMTVHVKRPFPAFEVVSRSTPIGPIAQTQPLAQNPTGNPQVDAAYLVATQEPGMAQWLGQVLPNFAVFVNAGVHLVGDGQRVSYVLQQDKAPLAASALYYAETMSSLLADLARRLSG